MYRRSNVVLVCVLAATAAGCSVSKKSVIPTDGPTMVEIYKAHQLRMGERAAANPAQDRLGDRPIEQREVDAVDDARSYARSESTQLTSQFRRLPNPDLTVYVFPHMGESGTPVPGYTTVIPMYDKPQYAMPGEVPPRVLHVSDR